MSKSSDPPVSATSALPQAPLSSQTVHIPKEPSASTVNISPRRTARIHKKIQPWTPENKHNVKRKKSKKGVDNKAMKTQVSETEKSNSSDSPKTTTVLPEAPLSVHIQKEPSASVRLTRENTIPRRTTRITKPNPPYSPEVENDLKKNASKKGNDDKEKKK